MDNLSALVENTTIEKKNKKKDYTSLYDPTYIPKEEEK